MSENIYLDNVNALPDFLTDERFRVVFSKLPGGVSGITAEDINLRTVKLTLPVTSVKYVTFTLHTHKKQQPAGRDVPDEFSMDLCEAIDMKTYEFLCQWREACCERNTVVVGDTDTREAEMLIYHLDNTNESKWVYKLKKVMLKSFTKPDFTDGDSPSVIISSLTLTCTDPEEGSEV